MKISIQKYPKDMYIGKKKYYLTANIFYSNIHYMIRQKIVKYCKEIIHYTILEKKIGLKPIEGEISIEIIFFGEKNPKWDLDNRGYFWMKIIGDYLTSQKIIEDDNVKKIKSIKMLYKEGKEDEIEINIDEYGK